MVWLGIDDTDGPERGCTTDLIDRLIADLSIHDPDVYISDVRLVRCWPMAPQRTRGNGAVACKVDTTLTIDEISAWVIEWFQGQEPWPDESSPACILSENQLHPTLYWNAVRQYVDAGEVLTTLETLGANIWAPRSKRGLVGASAAIAWPGTSDWSWELIAYRKEGGAYRDIDTEVLEKFDPDPDWNGTRQKGRFLCVPNTPCPILFGLRSREREALGDLGSQLQNIWGRPGLRSWRIFRSNQGTDDHLYGVTSGVVIDCEIIRGGHVRLVVDTGEEHVVWMAFREGGEVVQLARNLSTGDSIKGVGLVTQNGDLHLESLRTLKTHSTNQRCECGGSLTSMGTGQGRRCRRCRRRYPLVDIEEEKGEWSEWSRPPSDRRRHLSRRGEPPSLNLSL